MTTSSTLPLPIKLVFFKAQSGRSGVELTWATATEINNDRFDIERSRDGKTWETIKTVAGNGTTTEMQHYSCFDHNPEQGANYYRLAQYDYDASVSYSKVESVYFTTASSDIDVYPNPFQDRLSIDLKDYSGKTVVIELSDLQGRVVRSATVQADGSSYELLIENNLTSGVYLLNLTTDDGSKSKKVFVK